MKNTVIAILLGILGIVSVYGEDSIYTRVGDLANDVEAVLEDMGQLRLELERLDRENTALRAKIVSLEQKDTSFARDYEKLAKSMGEYQESFMEQVGQVREELKGQVVRIQERAQAGMDELAAKIKPVVEKPKPAKVFSNDYPKEGIEYTVKSGDTLSVIALKHNSSTTYIQNANKIADPKDLKAGQTIFIPIKKQS